MSEVNQRAKLLIANALGVRAAGGSSAKLGAGVKLPALAHASTTAMLA